VLGLITYAMPGLTGRSEDARETSAGFWSFWLQIAGMFGMTMAFAAGGITQTYLERILSIGYLETQLKLQVHFLMLASTGILFTAGVALFLWDFFFLAGRPVAAPAREGVAAARAPAV
jgi:nitric oxide reductase subunit B